MSVAVHSSSALRCRHAPTGRPAPTAKRSAGRHAPARRGHHQRRRHPWPDGDARAVRDAREAGAYSAQLPHDSLAGTEPGARRRGRASRRARRHAPSSGLVVPPASGDSASTCRPGSAVTRAPQAELFALISVFVVRRGGAVPVAAPLVGQAGTRRPHQANVPPHPVSRRRAQDVDVKTLRVGFHSAIVATHSRQCGGSSPDQRRRSIGAQVQAQYQLRARRQRHVRATEGAPGPDREHHPACPGRAGPEGSQRRG